MTTTSMIGEIQIFCGNFAPDGWLFCEGQTLPIDEVYGGLHFVIGTTYGGDGKTNFKLPDLRGRAPVGVGNNNIGTSFGESEVKLTVEQMPRHTHAVTTKIKVAATFARQNDPTDGYWAGPGDNEYAIFPEEGSYLAENAIKVTLANNISASESMPINNRQPLIAFNFIICAIDGEVPPHD
jgi:microcystin-dependent protein